MKQYWGSIKNRPSTCLPKPSIIELELHITSLKRNIQKQKVLLKYESWILLNKFSQDNYDTENDLKMIKLVALGLFFFCWVRYDLSAGLNVLQ